MSSPISPPIDRHTYPHLPRHSLILCASLVQNPTNLAGLCRTAEAFRLEAVVMADVTIAKTAVFRKVAASTQQWQPLLECPPSELGNWLENQRQMGYGIVGLQVSESSVALSGFEFPRRSVLVLGQELTGIPAAIVTQCDQLVSIPQFGLVESLNVQTAGAIATYEYIRQQGAITLT